MKNVMKTMMFLGMILFLIAAMESCKGKTEEEEIEELVEKMGEAKTGEEAAKIAEKIEKLEKRAKKSAKEVNIKLGQPFTFWNQVETLSDDMTQFSMTFEKVEITEEILFVPREAGKKYLMILAKTKNLGPRKSFRAPSGDDIQVKTEKGYLYRFQSYPGAFPSTFFSSQPPSFPLDYKTLDKWQFPFGVLGKSVDIFKESLEPEEIGWIIYWTSIPKGNTPVEVFGQFPTEPGPHGGEKRTNFRLKLTQFGRYSGQKEKEVISSPLQFPLKGDWKPILGFNVWSSNWCGRHLGEDVEREPETPIFPMLEGIVKFAQYQPKAGIGYGVIIEHNFNEEYLCSVYYHMREPTAKEVLKEGQAVSPDKPIGYISGERKDHLSIPHVHFGIRKGKYRSGRDPRTNRWYYPGYTTIYNKDGVRESNLDDPIHNEIAKEWYEPSQFINSTKSGFETIKRGEELYWVKCNNPACKSTYQIDKKDYYEQIEEKMRANPMAMVTPPLTCKECGEQSALRAVKCEKCGQVFFYGADPTDFADRCPECGHSKTESERKARAVQRGR